MRSRRRSPSSPSCGPSFVSVTYGALGSTRERTRDVVVRINRDQAFPAMAHLTCVGHTRADVDQLLDEYASNGVENILALGGDPPADGSEPGGDFAFARDLVEVVRAHPAGFSIGVAAHPELHPRSTGTADDRRRLAEKLELADFAVTQFFFDVDPYLRMVDELADLGCDKPILPGVMPFISVAGVQRMAAMNGTAIPAPLLERLEAAAGDPDEVVRDRRRGGHRAVRRAPGRGRPRPPPLRPQPLPQLQGRPQQPRPGVSAEPYEVVSSRWVAAPANWEL